MVYAICTDGSSSFEDSIVKTHGKPTLKIEAFTKEGHSGHNVLLWLKPDAELVISNSNGKGRILDSSELIKILEEMTIPAKNL
jgi:hypothetical protein